MSKPRSATPLELITAPDSQAVWKEKLEGYKRTPVRGWNTVAQTEMAIALTFRGRYQEALAILRQVEQVEHGRYATASNLGTLYELTGNIPLAIAWIQEGMRREPGSHRGTEWLHLRILKAKKELGKDPAWLAKNSVVGMDFGQGPEPMLAGDFPRDNLGRRADAREVSRALQYQLHERMQLVQPQDAIVADMLFDYANFTALVTDTSQAELLVPLYQKALEYGSAKPTLVSRRLAHYAATPPYHLFVAVGLVLMGLGLCLQRRWFGTTEPPPVIALENLPSAEELNSLEQHKPKFLGIQWRR